MSRSLSTSLPRFDDADAAELAFHRAVRERVDAWFEQSGTTRHANAEMVAKTLFWIGSSAAAWGLLVFAALPWPLTLAAWSWLGFSLAGIGLNVGHDAIHGGYSANRRVNRLMGWSYELIGANVRNWSVAHNLVHHTWTNVTEVDHDIEPGPLLRFHPDGARRRIHRYQHLYAWPLYALLTLTWVTWGDFAEFRRPHPYTGRRPGTGERIRLLVGKTSHFGLFLVVPLLLSPQPAWLVGAGFLLMHAVGGFTLSLVFQLAHVVEGPQFAPAAPTMPTGWAAHQLRTTANFGRGGLLVRWIAGGLDHQVEHHLFPAICHVHYRHLAPIVTAAAREFGLPYHAHPTTGAAIASHYRMLRALGRAEADGPSRA